jgi:hypothetical protein
VPPPHAAAQQSPTAPHGVTVGLPNKLWHENPWLVRLDWLHVPPGQKVAQVPPAVSGMQLGPGEQAAAAAQVLSAWQAWIVVAVAHMESTRPSSLPPAIPEPTQATQAAVPVPTG